jgi:hypothetical protein
MDKPLNSRERTCPLQGGATNICHHHSTRFNRSEQKKNIQIVKRKYHLQYYKKEKK